MSSYDVAVLGAGPGGYVAALRAAVRGAKTCCIEANLVGGTCLNVGCIPTKAMLHASAFVWQAGRAREFGISVGDARVDGAAYMERVARVTGDLRKGVEYLLNARKVDLVRGRGRLVGSDTIVVETAEGTKQIQAKSIIVATGSRPARPDFLPWDSERIVTTDEATTAGELPASVLVVGGGVIGCEFATLYAELGIPTTLVEMLDRLLPELDEDASKAVRRSLLKRKVKIHTGARIVAVKATDTGIQAELESGKAIEAACALVVVGRQPNVEDIGLETLGVDLEDGIIRADDKCRTSVDGVYAIGDVAEQLQYAHLASRMGIVAADNAAGLEASDSRAIVPVGVYTHPEMASVGLAESVAREKHGDVRVARFPYQASGMARAYGETEGQVKIVGDGDTGRILGALVIGQHATDVIQEVALAMRHNLTVEDVAETIHPHPTFAEGLLEAAEAWLGLPTHTLG